MQQSIIEALPDERADRPWLRFFHPRVALWASGAFLFAYAFVWATGSDHEAGHRAYFVDDTVVEWTFPNGRIVRVAHPAHTVTEMARSRGDYALIRVWTGEGDFAVAWIPITSLYLERKLQ
ncbi:hypothetical protein [Methylosinus sp. LW4]|uniref:hypothetical protein n=1 Tax=Methylosinus sp. LW4 TaxID=136993 RepID=UPI0012F9A5C3|nr:hypothetical protein [Methylosinus sp. LW4]